MVKIIPILVPSITLCIDINIAAQKLPDLITNLYDFKVKSLGSNQTAPAAALWGELKETEKTLIIGNKQISAAVITII